MSSRFSSSSSSIISKASLIPFAVGLVLGIIITMILTSSSNSSAIMMNSNSNNNNCPSLLPPNKASSSVIGHEETDEKKTCPPRNNEKQRKEKDEAESPAPPRQEEENIIIDTTKITSSSSSACHPFMHEELRTFILAKTAANPSSPNNAVSIVKAGYDYATIIGSKTDSASSSLSRSFREIGDSFKDDKTLYHRYDRAYDAYLGHPSVRGNSHKLSVFEIGLGCNQHEGVGGIGASARLWGEYLPKARLAMLEYDEKCAKKWLENDKNRDAVPKGGFKLYTGDQSSPQTWDKVFSAENEGVDRMYDVIIDDGGHKMKEQIVTFQTLWKHVKPGGVYFLEDMQTSWKTRYQGTKRMMSNSKTTNNMVKTLMDRVHAVTIDKVKQSGKSGNGGGGKMMMSGASYEDDKMKSSVARVDCMHFICVISKKYE